MAKMGKYCKAYLLKQFSQFSQWTEQIKNIRKETRHIYGKEDEVERELTNEDVLYLQETYAVTDDTFLDEHIIFDNVTPEGKGFCQTTLRFEIPVYEPGSVRASAGKDSDKP